MSIRVTCPSCEGTFAVNDDLAGKKIRCRECKEPVAVPSAAKAGKSNGTPAATKKSEAISTRPTSAAAAKGPSRKRAEEDDDDNEDEDDRPKAKSRKRDDDDDDDDDDRPKAKSRKRDDDDDDRPKRKSAAKKNSMMLPLLLGGGALALLVLVAGGVGAFLVLRNPGPAKDNPPLAQGGNGGGDQPGFPPGGDPKPDDPAAKKDKNDPPAGENPFKPAAGQDPFKPVAGPVNLITPDWSGARQVDMVPAAATWNVKVNPAPALTYKPTPTPVGQLRGWEGCRVLLVNPVARRAIVSYALNEKGKVTSRMAFCDIANGKLLSNFIIDGDVESLAINDEGTQGLFRRELKGKTMLELWSLSEKGVAKVLEFRPAEAKDPEQTIRLAVFLDAKRLLTASNQGKVVVWDMPAVKPIYHMANAGGAALSPDRKLLGFVIGEQLGVLDVDAGKVLAMKSTPPFMPFPAVSFSPGGKWISCAVMNRVIVWDAATGALYREIIPVNGVNFFGRAPWVSDKHLLLGNHALTDIDMPYTFWDYNGPNHVQVSHGLTWFVTHESNFGVITTAVLPHPAAVQGYDKGVKELALKPGTVVKIVVSALPDQAEAAKVAKTLEEKLAKIGCTAGPTGTLELVAYADVGKEVKMAFTPILPKKKGPGKGPPPLPEKVQIGTIQEHFARLKFVWQGKELWETKGDNLPKEIRFMEGETLQQHLKSLEKPNYAFYQTIELPPMLMQQPGAKTIVGTTKVTNGGLQ